MGWGQKGMGWWWNVLERSTVDGMENGVLKGGETRGKEKEGEKGSK